MKRQDNIPQEQQRVEGLFTLLGTNPSFLDIVEKSNTGQICQIQATKGGNPLILSGLWDSLNCPTLVITPRPDDARLLYQQTIFYLGTNDHILLLPETDILPFERLATDRTTNNQRLMVLDSLCESTQQNPSLVIAPLGAILRKTLPKKIFQDYKHIFSTGQTIQLGKATTLWAAMGYRRDEWVDMPGTFSVRGGIVDIFPSNSRLPARLDLKGNEIDSMHFFDPVTQRSIKEISNIAIPVAQEMLPLLANEEASDLIEYLDFSQCSSETYERFHEDILGLFTGDPKSHIPFYNGLINTTSVLDYFSPSGTLILYESHKIENEAKVLEVRMDDLRRGQIQRGDLPSNFPHPNLSWEQSKEEFRGRKRIDLSLWDSTKVSGNLGFLSPPLFHGHINHFCNESRRMLSEGHSVTVVTRYANRLAEILEDAQIPSTILSKHEPMNNQKIIGIIPGRLDQGWILPFPEKHVIFLTDAEVFGIVKENRPQPKKLTRKVPFLASLEPGKYVVHENHGVARFAGITKMALSGEDKEYLILEYAEKDRLYIPTDQLDHISPYATATGKVPNLTRLGSAEWNRVKERVKISTQILAKELLRLYANRQLSVGHAFSSDFVWQKELEDSFPYEETSDQIRTIEEVKADMEQRSPMDRLICGDVGYGKTEMALRAAFKTVSDGMQVAILVPTTILAQQHYSTFTNRLSPYPINVEMLSRFRTPKDQSRIVGGIQQGAVDIVIGTHRILQRDIKFKNLGLVIVDEEQRFGVSHKERLKNIRQNVDFLTLSATPIPRTLQMSFSGIRDMSTMETPPEERLPVKTYVGEYSDQIIEEGIIRELDRGGQVFYLHNRVASIRRVANRIASQIPQATVGMAHGRMSEDELETAMQSFNNGETDVLVCTTIIESGLDIPNANTLIIERADRFGLSQLYQLRGRVGRSSNRAYSYLLLPKGRHITPEAEQRLSAILEASELGAGFHIAMRDLEIRGAGNILGAEQSGHIHAIGFELYNQLLDQAVNELRIQNGNTQGKPQKDTPEIRVDLPLPAYIPEDYISHLPNRLSIYQRLTDIDDPSHLEDIRVELRDRFGVLPRPVHHLLYLVLIKVMALELGILSITSSKDTIVISLAESVGGARLALERSLGDSVSVGNRQIRLNNKLRDVIWTEDLITILGNIKRFLNQYNKLASS